MARPLQSLTVDDFRPAVGETFALQGDKGVRLELELVKAATFQPDAPPRDAEGRRTQFHIVFHGPLTPLMPQRIYPLESDLFGTLDLFVVPLGPDGPQDAPYMVYEAVFA